MADIENGGPSAQITSGMPDMKVKVLPGNNVDYGEGDDRQSYGPGKAFVCHGSEAVELMKAGHVDVVGTVREGSES